MRSLTCYFLPSAISRPLSSPSARTGLVRAVRTWWWYPRECTARAQTAAPCRWTLMYTRTTNHVHSGSYTMDAFDGYAIHVAIDWWSTLMVRIIIIITVWITTEYILYTRTRAWRPDDRGKEELPPEISTLQNTILIVCRKLIDWLNNLRLKQIVEWSYVPFKTILYLFRESYSLVPASFERNAFCLVLIPRQLFIIVCAKQKMNIILVKERRCYVYIILESKFIFIENF